MVSVFRNVLIAFVLVAIAVAVYSLATMTRPNSLLSEQPATSVSNEEDVAVRATVEAFGEQLQKVSLLASDRAAAMNTYQPYVAPELIAAWSAEGAEALGRYSSSPWPARINIVEVRRDGARYVVEGNVIEVTNSADGVVPAAVYPVALTLENRAGTWLIVGMTKGAYSQVPHTQTIVGFWECLPHKNTSGPQTAECAFGIAVDQSDGHFAIDTSSMNPTSSVTPYPVDYPTGTKVRVTGLVTPANQLSSPQKYDIDGIISATKIEKI